MKEKFSSALLVFCLLLPHPAGAQVKKYESNWESLSKREIPAWFPDAKFGIFIHWGVYSVPSYRYSKDGFDGVYAEWYAPDVMYKPWRNDDFHRRVYGDSMAYRDFAKLFKAELWDPGQWADVFSRSGAKYVVLTAKHHDGYCLWATKDTLSKGWNSMDTGPHRDIVRELSQAVTARGMKFGTYYSLLEWESTKTDWPPEAYRANEKTGYYLPKYIWDKYHIPDTTFVKHLHFQLKELVLNYRPDIIFADGEWDYPDSYWKSTDFLAWLYNKAPNKRTVVVNDRWGSNTRGVYGDYFTSEYSKSSFNDKIVWEECQGIGHSFGFNRAENLEQYKTSGELIELLAKTVCAGGNLLLNVGPTADGRIPPIQQERLADIGRWLNINGKGIYKSRPFRIESEEFTYTSKGDRLYAFQYSWTQGSLAIPVPENISIKSCKLLGHEGNLAWKRRGDKMYIIPPVISPDNENLRHVYVYEMIIDQE